jgi:hypothetical protein
MDDAVRGEVYRDGHSACQGQVSIVMCGDTQYLETDPSSTCGDMMDPGYSHRQN